MAVKKAAPLKKPVAKKTIAAKKTAPAKKAAPARKAAVRKSVAGKSLECYVCGMVVTIDEDCGCIEQHTILCCEEPMKARKKAPVKARK